MPKLIDLTGHKYNKLTVLQRSSKKHPKKVYWDCICDCGNEHTVSSASLRHNQVKSCGCLIVETSKRNGKKNKIDLKGQKFNRLLVLEEDRTKGKLHWLCLCDCGNTKLVEGHSLTSGAIKSCGCLHSELTILRNKIGGFQGKGQLKNLSGKKFGKLFVIKRSFDRKYPNISGRQPTFWECKCDCGNIFIAAGQQLKNGGTVSCGCKKKEKHSHCIHGHELLDQNVGIDSKGNRHCKECMRIRNKSFKYIIQARKRRLRRERMTIVNKLKEFNNG